MYAHSPFWHFLWLAPTGLLAVVAVMMFRRGLHREYPVFFLYTLWQIVFIPLLFVLDHLSVVTPYQYQFAYWVAEVGCIALRFAIIYEVFSVLFRPYRALKQLASILTSIGLIALLVAAAVVANYGPTAAHSDRIVGSMFLLDRAVGFVQCGLLVILFVLSWYFNLSWRSYILGIAIGFGVFSAAQIVTNALMAEPAPPESMSFLVMGAYNICALIWTAYLLVPERATTEVRSVPALDLESWNRELERLLQR
jgi:hypothetical protein